MLHFTTLEQKNRFILQLLIARNACVTGCRVGRCRRTQMLCHSRSAMDVEWTSLVVFLMLVLYMFVSCYLSFSWMNCYPTELLRQYLSLNNILCMISVSLPLIIIIIISALSCVICVLWAQFAHDVKSLWMVSDQLLQNDEQCRTVYGGWHYLAHWSCCCQVSFVTSHYIVVKTTLQKPRFLCNWFWLAAAAWRMIHCCCWEIKTILVYICFTLSYYL